MNPGAPTRNDALLADGDGCYHCGEPLPVEPARFELDGTAREFCCDGCAAAAQWIRDAHLGDYYRLRSDHASRARGPLSSTHAVIVNPTNSTGRNGNGVLFSGGTG